LGRSARPEGIRIETASRPMAATGLPAAHPQWHCRALQLHPKVRRWVVRPFRKSAPAGGSGAPPAQRWWRWTQRWSFLSASGSQSPSRCGG